ncbi:Do family serine endopeptidase [Acidisoma silvae]|uniref:Probable periplasmic serine endoprotease DegP-like n=1 Tax=Acidisoma silvae TaxID=2802396 RepID=A0A963YQJ8_9PROT|nr:Do family serine endopeptidase [Acidisoma silvae]MCB8875140.1 Do family serine endopeptidase [Acidisoma silvae]
MTRRLPLRSALAVALLTGSALGGYALSSPSFADAAPSGAVDVSHLPPGASAQVLPDFTELASRVKPAVVTILSDLNPNAMADDSIGGNQGGGDQGGDQGDNGSGGDQGPQAQNGLPFPLPFPFNMMPGAPGMGGAQPHPQAVEAAGSGFIINGNGTIVTNNHVVQGAKTITVTLSDGTRLPAKLIGRDPSTDIAVLKVDAKHPLPYLDLGSSAKVQTGQWVIAMGNPFGLGGTVTAGIVSAEGRDIGDGPYDSFLQIDAPINKGNSGGPLFDQAGEVIGMNTAILSPSGGSIGIGFAIPADTIKAIVAQIIKDGHVTRGFLGVEAQSIDAGMAQALHLPGDSQGALNGALIAQIEPSSPAAKAGLQPGDVIQKVNGTVIHTPRDLAINIAGINPGQNANLSIVRNGKTQDVSVEIAQLKSKVAANKSGSPASSQGGVGLALAPLTPDLRGQLGVPDGTDGAVVAQVRPNSPADQAGIQQGDVVLGVNSAAIGSPNQAASAIHAALQSGGGAVALRILRQGQPIFVAITPDKTAG